MKMKKWLAAVLTVVLLLGLAGCGDEEAAVYVQSVQEIVGMGSIALGDKFPGMVVSENVTEIQKDNNKTVAEILVKEGDDVAPGQELFSYDSDELQLTLDKQKLELEQMQTQIESYKDQIAALEKEKKTAPQNDQLQYTVQIQSLQADQKETEFNIKAKEAEIAQSESILENITVLSPVAGRVQSISENGTDNYGNPLPYITIQQTGSYRIKGTIGELQRGSLMEGTRMRILSRMNDREFWTGTVTMVDYENPSQGTGNEMYYGSYVDSMSSSSKYPFYVELDSAEGLILGQHVYLEVDGGVSGGTGLQLPSYFVCTEESGESFVWAENSKGKLEKRILTLGDYNEMMDTYEVLEGLSPEDYIAVPNMDTCKTGVPTTHDYVEPDPMENMPMDGGFADGNAMDGDFAEGDFTEGDFAENDAADNVIGGADEVGG